MLNTTYSPWPSFTTEEADAVRDVLLSNQVNYWTGTECRSFETEFAAWAGVQHAVALEVERVMQGLAILETQPRGDTRLLRQVADYSMPNVSDKVLHIIHSYTDYVNRVVWKKY